MEIVLIWLGVVVVMAGLSGLGRLIAPPLTSPTSGPLWWGWGLGAVIMTLYAVLVVGQLNYLLILLGFLSLVGYTLNRPSREECLATLKLSLLSIPFIWAWSHNQVFAWDDFSHRLPSLQYVYLFDSLPRHDLPASLSGFPSYPYALTILGLAISRMVGSYSELSIAMINSTILIAFAGILAQLFAGTNKTPTWKLTAASLLLVTFLCPIFKATLVSTAYQDVSLGLALAVSFILLIPYLRSDNTPTFREALAIGLVLALTTGLKQVGLVLAVMLIAPVTLLFAYRLKKVPTQTAFIIGALSLPTIIIWLAWRYYVAKNIGGGEFSFLPWAEWQWHLLPQMLQSLLKISIQKPFVCLLLLAVSGLALASLRVKRLANLKLLLALASIIGWGYFTFLFITYIGSFSSYEAGILASLSRYMLHVNWMLWVAVLVTLKELCGPWISHRRWIGTACLVLLMVPVVIPHKFIGKMSPEGLQMKTLAGKLPSLLPTGKNLLIRLDDPESSGYRRHVLQYYVGYGYQVEQGSTTFGPQMALTKPDAIIKLGSTEEAITLTRCAGDTCQPPETITIK